MRDAVIVEAVRTPVGKRNGGLSGVHPADLSAHVLSHPGRPVRAGPGPGRRRRLGLRLPVRRADLRHRPHRGARRGLAGVGARHHGRPAVRVLPAGRALRRRRAGRRALRRRRRRWHRVDVPGADGLLARRAGPDGPAVHGPLRRRQPQPGHRRGDDRRPLGAVPHPARRVRPPLARARRHRAGRGPLRRPDRPGRRPRGHGSPGTRASAAAGRWRRWPGSRRRSRPTAW